MVLSGADYDRVHELERVIKDEGRPMEDRKEAIRALLAEFGAEVQPILLGISVGHWLQPLPGDLVDEAARCVQTLRETTLVRGRQRTHGR
jgi:hypothetical protein